VLEVVPRLATSMRTIMHRGAAGQDQAGVRLDHPRQITVATQDTVTQLVSMMRRVAREVLGAAARIAAECAGDCTARQAEDRLG